MYFNKNVRFIRTKLGLSQDAFARLMGVSRGNISSYEKKTEPPYSFLVLLAEKLNLSVDTLLRQDFETVGNIKNAEMNMSNLKIEGMYDRISELMEITGLDFQEWIDMLNVDRSRLKRMLSKKKGLSIEKVFALFQNFPWLSVEWLLLGNGRMTKGIVYSLPDEQSVLEKAADPFVGYQSESVTSASYNVLFTDILKRLDVLEKKMTASNDKPLEASEESA